MVTASRPPNDIAAAAPGRADVVIRARTLPRRPRSGEAGRAVLVSTLALFFIAFCLFVVGNSPLLQLLLGEGPPSIGRTVEDRTGKIISAPVVANRCRELLLDNATGRLDDRGLITCDGDGEAPAGGSGRRLGAIRDSFAKKSQ